MHSYRCSENYKIVCVIDGIWQTFGSQAEIKYFDESINSTFN